MQLFALAVFPRFREKMENSDWLQRFLSSWCVGLSEAERKKDFQDKQQASSAVTDTAMNQSNMLILTAMH